MNRYIAGQLIAVEPMPDGGATLHVDEPTTAIAVHGAPARRVMRYVTHRVVVAYPAWRALLDYRAIDQLLGRATLVNVDGGTVRVGDAEHRAPFVAIH